MESDLQALVRIEESRRGNRLWRNNVGVAFSRNGTPIRFGLANESQAVNQKIKSSDLIGITPIIITPEHIGRRLGVFTSEEIKRPGWHYTGTPRETAQLAWLNIVNSLGGIGKFVCSLEDL